MQIIDDKTVVVTTSNDLKEALSLDNGYLYIYFGNDFYTILCWMWLYIIRSQNI